MKTHRLTPSDAEILFRHLYAGLVSRKNGLGDGGIEVDCFTHDRFIIQGSSRLNGVPLPRHVRFNDGATSIANAPCLPELLVAEGLLLAPQDMRNFLLLDASPIQRLFCHDLTLINPGKFPRLIHAIEIRVQQTQEEGCCPDLSNCMVRLNLSLPWVHEPFLLLLAGLPEENRLNLRCTVSKRPLHIWGCSPDCMTYWEKLTRQKRDVLTSLFNWYESIHDARERTLAALNSSDETTMQPVILDVDLV